MKVDYVVGNTQARLVWLVIISAITGWVLGIVTAFLIRRRTRWRGPT
ncbi:MAG: LapA family protein [Gaiellaceae bacterium]